MDAAHRAKAAEVYLVERGLCAAMGAGISLSGAEGNLIVDIGAGITEIALVCLNGIIYSRILRVAGAEMDDAIAQYIKRKYNLLIGNRTAETLKIELGAAFPLDEELAYEIRGRNLSSGSPQTITITDEEVREAIADSVSTIIYGVHVALEQIPPELSADVVERGIVLTGGGALLKHFVKRLSMETGLPVSLVDHPLDCVVLGAAKIMSDLKLLERIKLRI
jgi:rod shape-determining protein MreB